jgi:Kdo2-lipid IVA lauroyltransferase/acyltransferase
MSISQKLKFFPFFLGSLIPMRLLYIFSDIGFVVIFYILKLRRRVTLENLLRSFPEKDHREIRRIEKAFYRHFCDSFIESVKLLTIRKKNICRRYRIINPGLIDSLYARQKSIILYTAHFGNWEWMAAMPLYMEYQVIAFYQQQKNKYFDTLMNLLRGRFGVQLVESKKGYKRLIELAEMKIPTASIIVGDQSPSKQSSMQRVTFLHQSTAFLAGVDRFANKFDEAVVFPLVKKVKRGFYEIELVLLKDETNPSDPSNVIAAYAKALESAIIRHPDHWLWSHRRWKKL